MGLSLAFVEGLHNLPKSRIYLRPAITLGVFIAKRGIIRKIEAVRGVLQDSETTHFNEEPQDENSSEWVVWKMAFEGRAAALNIVNSASTKEKIDTVSLVKELIRELSRLKDELKKSEFEAKVDNLQDPVSKTGIMFFIEGLEGYLDLLKFIDENGISDLGATKIYDNMVEMAEKLETANRKALDAINRRTKQGSVLAQVLDLLGKAQAARYKGK